MANPDRSCTTCHKLESEVGQALKYCAQCKITTYCSPECQKADWKRHKTTCAGRKTTKHNPGFEVANMLVSGGKNDYLHGLSEKDAFNQLVDCFRFRVEDEYKYGRKNIGIYGGENPRPHFKKFLDLAESRKGLLPPWWNTAKRQECEAWAVDKANWSDINYAVEKDDIMDHYKDNMMPMKLRVLGEKIYGKGVM